MVGGVCDYDEYMGQCEFTSVSGKDVSFRYKSTVDGKDVVLEDNTVFGEVMAGGAKVGDTFGCKLTLIANGTCTPCLFISTLFTFGECGPEAWDLFRKR